MKKRINLVLVISVLVVVAVFLAKMKGIPLPHTNGFSNGG